MKHLEDSSVQEFDAEVVSVKDGRFVVLNQTYFYPLGGGQPHDEGMFIRESDNKEFRVCFVGKFDGKVSHEVEQEGLAAGDKVTAKIDWQRRHKLMRSHTAAHIVCKVVGDATGAKITGNQLDMNQVRFDFSLDEYDPEVMPKYIEEANRLIAEAHPVRTRMVTREEADAIPEVSRLMVGLPAHIKEVRLVEIEGLDLQACGGTHVKNTAEIGELRFVKAQNKGKNNRRVYFELVS